jgi:hypothetical protein
MAATRPKSASVDGAVGPAGVGCLMLVFMLIAVVLFYVTIAYWPPSVAAGDEPDSTIKFFGNTYTISRDMQLLMTVAFLGALGAMIHVIRSFIRYVGERRLVWSWIPSYFLIPFVGAGLAMITYIVLRAGLLGGVGDGEGNIWGFASIAALVGLFSAQAASKLKDVFETILTPAKQGTDPIKEKDPVPPIDFSPLSGAVGSPVVITGGGLTGVAPVTFGGGKAGESPAWDDAAKTLTVTVPGDATSGPLTVKVGDSDFVTTKDFTVVAP